MQTVSRWDLNGERLRPHCFLEAAEWTGLIYDIEKAGIELGIFLQLAIDAMTEIAEEIGM